MIAREARDVRVLMLVENLSVPRDRRVWQEARSLTEAGYRVHAVCPAGAGDESRRFELRDGVAIHRFPITPARGGAREYAREYAAAFWRIARLAWRLDREHRFDVVHVANPPDVLVLAALPLKLRGAKVIFDHHELVPELYGSRFGSRNGVMPLVLRALERVSFALADVVISTNESYRDVATGRGGKSRDAVFVVRNGPDAAFLSAVDGPQPATGREHLLAYVGTMAPQDGVDHALRALAYLRDRRRDWRAVFAGEGDALPELRRLASRLGLEDLVEFAGFLAREQVKELLGRADVCLAPEPRDPYNDASTMIKITEYMALGRPVVAYDLKESRFTAGEAALYAVPNDERSFAECIERLLDDAQLRARMGSAGRRRAESELSWAESEQALLRAYGTLAGGARRRHC